jgi:glycosyltransferase involved in cell wall biosynthesis
MMDRPLRFCMITTFYPPYNFGGDGMFVHQLSNELARRGHQVEVIHCIDTYRFLARREPVRGYQDHPNVTVHGLESHFGLLSPLATQQTGYPLFKSARIKQILDRGFDVIHYHNPSLVGGPKVLELGRGIKLYTIHEYWLICPTHVLFRFNRAPCTRPHCLACVLADRRPPQWWRYTGLLQAALKHVDAFLAPSQFIKNKHQEKGLDLPIVHLPHFVSAAEVASPPAEEVAVEEEDSFFLFVGRLEKLKGLQTLIPIFQHYPKARLLIAGTGQYESHLRRLAKGSDNIRFLGYLSGSQLQTLYPRAIAAIVPTLAYENFALVVLEAFRHGTPVIVRNIGGMPEMVAQSQGGIVYNTDEELLAALDQLLEDRSLRDELGRRGYQAFQQHWTAEVHLQRYLALIQEIAACRGQVLHV